MEVEAEGKAPASNGDNRIGLESQISDSEKMDLSMEEVKMNGHAETIKAEENNTSQEDSAEVSSTPDQITAPAKMKRRRSSALKSHLNDSADVGIRSSRTRKPKNDAEDFLPTDAVLGKSPKKAKKDIDSVALSTRSTDPKVPHIDSELNGTAEDLLSGDLESSEAVAEDVKDSSAGLEESSDSESQTTTEYVPGDLIWGRIGRHPFWPCIVIRDHSESIYFKTSGHKRLSYHVLFYNDNGKRSWVPSSCIRRFLGLPEFQEMQAAASTKEVKKTNPKLFSGFNVKPNMKEIWEVAVQEAEEVMPMTRDERLDAFLDAMRQMMPKKYKAFDESQCEDSQTEEGEVESSASPSPVKKKKKLSLKTESPPIEKRKRGRPRKLDVSLNQSGLQSPEPAANSTPGPGRPRKRKLLNDDAQPKQVANAELSDDDPDSNGEQKVKKRKRRKRKDEKNKGKKAFKLFAEELIERVMDENPDITEDEAQHYLRLLWDRKDEDEKSEYIHLLVSDELSEVEAAPSEDENDGRDDTGVEEEVATVASADPAKEVNEEEAPVVISKKKINLFRGYKPERVCQNCEKPGNTVRCRGPCAGVFHVECALGADNSVGQFRIVEEAQEKTDKPKKRGRKKRVPSPVELQEVPKSKSVKRPKNIYAEEEMDSDLDYADGEAAPEVFDEDAIMKMILGETSALPEVTVVEQEESEEEEIEEDDDEHKKYSNGPLPLNASGITDFRCGDCAVLRVPLCFVCGQATVPSGDDSERIRCSVAHCGKHYHIECLKVLWPQASYSSHNGVIQTLTCPQHKCHTCISDNPRDCIGRFTHEKLVRCIRCPTSYHYGNYCVPAGSEILTASQIICPRHSDPPKKANHHINAAWCFICSIGGSLICCDLCPSSFHVDCLKIKPPTGSYICEDCETGRFPLYNEVLWVKLGNYRWWPALSLFPSEVPENVKNCSHNMGSFAVRFLGTNEHYWVERGRCFVYHEEDVKDVKKTSKSSMEANYLRGVMEAKELHKAHKELRAQIQNQIKLASTKPPQFIKIKTNKAVGSVKITEVNTSNNSPCECDPTSEHPCSPDSECLNRILMVECDPNTCPAGEKCENQCFEKRIYPALAPCCTNGRGWGLETLEDIKKGGFVIEYVGEVIDDEEYQRRLQKKHEEKDENYYFLTIDCTRMIDAGPKGNVSRFMNHSCDPNCETQKWTVLGDTRVGLFALRDIPARTELTFNYNLESKGNEKKPCMCGTSGCSGFIGAKKNKAPLADEVSSTGKKKRRKPRVRNLIEDVCVLCDADKEAGVLISCINKELCASKYHLHCLGLSSIPLGKWLCPRHRCNVCQKKTQQWCSYCTESYCPAHVEGNLVNDPLHGEICEVHQKNPLSRDDQKKKRDEERKRKEEEKLKLDEEKRKQYEEERARRRSRREQISKDEEVAKVKRRKSDLDDAASESSTFSDDKPVKFESADELTSKITPPSEDELESKLKEKTSLSKTEDNHIVAASLGEKVVKRRGRKKKEVPSEMRSPPASPEIKKEAVMQLTQISSLDDQEVNLEAKSAEKEEAQISSSGCKDSCVDDIPDADPTLDKFIAQTPTPMDDEPLPKSPDTPSTKKAKLSSPQPETAVPNEASPSSITKRRRKPPMHKMDYVNSLHLNLKTMREITPDKGPAKKTTPKNVKAVNFDKDSLSGELEDLATGFASDDGQKSPKPFIKKASVRGGKVGRGGKRLSLGVVKSQIADSTTNGVGEKNSHLKSPDHSLKGLPLEKLSASQMFAMQKAKGLKVMPPNRRLSLAREQALSANQAVDVTDPVERSGKGLKVLKGRRFSAETNTDGKKTENLHSDVLQSGVNKKGRPVLSKVEDNGVSNEEEIDDKVVENSALPTPKLLQSHPIQSPPRKKMRPASPKKQSSALGVTALWNNDILNIMK